MNEKKEAWEIEFERICPLVGFFDGKGKIYQTQKGADRDRVLRCIQADRASRQVNAEKAAERIASYLIGAYTLVPRDNYAKRGRMRESIVEWAKAYILEELGEFQSCLKQREEK